MTRSGLISGIAALVLVVSASAAQASICAVGLVFSALVVNATQNRPLTAQEAMTCGLAALFAPPPPPARVVARY